MCERFPELILKYTGESCAMFFLGKTPMWFLIMIIPQESLTGSFKDSKGRTIMSSKHSFLPELIKAFNRGISSRFSLRDEYKVDTQKQVKANDLGKAVGIASSTGSSHLVIHLRYTGNAHISPCLNQMFAQRYSLFIRKLTCESCVSCNIHCMKRIESGDTFWTSEVPWPNKVCLMQISDLLCLKVRIRLIIAISFGLNFTCFSVAGENSGNGRDGRDMTNLSLVKFPANNLCTNAGESRTLCFVRFQLCPDRENLFNQIIRGFSPDSFWSTTLVFETVKPMFFISVEPFGEPNSAPLNQLKYLIKAESFIIKLYCLTAFLIFILILHRLFLLPKVFGRSLGDVKFT